jgi:hypothetical protein
MPRDDRAQRFIPVKFHDLCEKVMCEHHWVCGLALVSRTENAWCLVSGDKSTDEWSRDEGHINGEDHQCTNLLKRENRLSRSEEFTVRIFIQNKVDLIIVELLLDAPSIELTLRKRYKNARDANTQ